MDLLNASYVFGGKEMICPNELKFFSHFQQFFYYHNEGFEVCLESFWSDYQMKLLF